MADLAVLVCSANLGNAEPHLDDMAAWVPKQGACSSVTTLPGVGAPSEGECFDLVVIGMQEATWSAKNAQKGGGDDGDDDNNDNGAEEEEENNNNKGDAAAIEKEVNKDISKLASLIESTLGGEYKLIAEKQRGQMRLIIYSKKDLVKQITDLQIKCENTGVARVLANKGGIVMSFVYQKTTRITFLSAHLAAHEGDNYYANRQADVLEILNGAKTHERYDVSLSSHYMFLLGDLNFRCRFDTEEKEESVKQALALIQEGNFETLYEHDELHKGIANGDLLVEFETLPCNFNPTFKVQREAGFVYKEQRTPSYTDRILYRSFSPKSKYLKPLAYEPCPGFTTSDHKPIRGAFAITPNSVVDKAIRTDEAECSYRLTFSKMSCTDLPALDLTGTSDPYIMFTWDDFVQIADDHEQKGVMKWTSPRNKHWPKTKFQKRTLNPTFEGEEVVLSLNGPVEASGRLFVTVMDYDLHSADDLIATLPLNFRDIVLQLSEDKSSKGQVNIDRPLLKNGKAYGHIKMTIDVEKSNDPIAMTSGVKQGCFFRCGGKK